MILVVVFSTGISFREPTVSGQLYVVNEDGTMQEIPSAEQRYSVSDFSRKLTEDLERLEGVHAATAFCESTEKAQTYQVMVIYDDGSEGRYEALLSCLNQYVGNLSVIDKTIYEDQIQLTFVIE
jgi:hypothetical protein